MAKEKRATWWKMFYHQRAVVESVSDADAGMGLKAAFRYFDGEDISPEELTPAAFTIFCIMRPYIDESKRDYEFYTEQGKRGGRPPQKGGLAPLRGSKGVKGGRTEAEADADAEAIDNTKPKPFSSTRTEPSTDSLTVEEEQAGEDCGKHCGKTVREQIAFLRSNQPLRREPVEQ